ncbi:hypothetical protein KUCAC02_023645, partial [Chaenocephalus aceratus]
AEDLVPKKGLLRHITLVDLPGNRDRNKSRDPMWKKVVGSCSTVWIVAETNRAASEKESWVVLEDSCSLMGNGGECQQIHLICTKSAADVRALILKQNEQAKIDVKAEFSKLKDVKGKKVLHFPSVQSVLHDNASASGAFDKAAEKYSQVINRLGQEFENRFSDFGQLEPCVSFISNPFMQVDLTCIAEQLSATFNMDAGQVEIEILTCKMTSTSKPIRMQQTVGALWTQKSTKVYAQQL